MPALILQLTRVGFLILLWLFVLAAIRVVRADLRAASDLQVARAGRRRARRAGPKLAVAGNPMVPTTLVVTAGSLAGTRLRLGSMPILIGRAEDSTLVLDDDYASTRHARIIPQGNGYAVEDLGSTNGTYLDRTRVTTAPMPVPVGLPIRIGRTVIELRP